jgi:hypothetical protein
MQSQVLEATIMHRRGLDRTTDSDPATQGALSVPKALSPMGDAAGLHREDEIDRLLDRENRSDDDVTARPHRHHPDPVNERPLDPQSPEELAAEALSLASQGGGSQIDEDDEPSLETEIDRDAIAAGIVPQLVGQATLESASNTEDEVIERTNEVDEDAPTWPRTKTATSRERESRVTRRRGP